MAFIKKQIELYKLNKKIRELQHAITPIRYIGDLNPRVKESEHTFILREHMNHLIDERELLKKS